MTERRKLKKATNLVEAHRVFETNHPLDVDERELYVDIYTNDIHELQSELVLNDIPNKSFFVTGQSGNGKTTALNFLADQEIRDQYDVRHIDGMEVFDLEDIDIIDVILMVALSVVEGDVELEEKFLAELEEIKETKQNKLEKQVITSEKTQDDNELGGGFGFNILGIGFKIGFKEKYRVEKETRDSVRKLFSLSKPEIIEKANDIIKAYQRKTENTDKYLLLIIDDLEKIRNYEQAQKLFIENSGIFEKLNCVKITLFPLWLATKHAMFKNASKFGIRLDKNPKDLGDAPDRQAEKNKEKLKELVFRRLDNKKLATEEAVEAAVEISGGSLRLLIEIMQKAVRGVYMNVRADKSNSVKEEITEPDIKKAAKKLAEIPALAVMRRANTLDYIMKSHQEPNDESMQKDFIESLDDNCILAYFNGDPWYDVNPLVKGSVKTYARNALKPKEK